MRKIIAVTLGILSLAATSKAQDTSKADVSASYSFLREGGSGGINANGGSFSVAGNVNRWLGIAGDVGIAHASPLGVSLNTYTFLLGPRLSYRSSDRVTPFAQVLVGGAHLTAGLGGNSASTSGFAYSAGGGVDLGLSKRIALRPQFDFIGIHSGNNTLNSFRSSFGIVFRFGK